MIWKGKIPGKGFLEGISCNRKGGLEVLGDFILDFVNWIYKAKKFPRRGEENGSIYIGNDLSY